MSMNDAGQTNEPRSRYSGGLRAADTDREATATRLRRHYTAGRLNQSEYEERIDRCYAAKWVGELAELTLDLPPDAPQGPEPGDARHDVHFPAWWPLPLVPILIAFVALSALTHGHAFWFPWPLLFLFFFFGPFGRRCRGGWRRRGESETTANSPR